MAQAINKKTIIKPYRIEKQVFVEDTMFFGLIKYMRLESATTIGDSLCILTEKEPENVQINGIKYVPTINHL